MNPTTEAQSPFHSFNVKKADGSMQSLAEYKDKVILVVNVASRCGFTNQYTGLEALYRKYRDQGFVVLGFPCNQFGAQEPGSDQDIQTFCRTNYDVSFPVFAKIDVNGQAADPLYRWLTETAPGLLGSEAIKWNFTKFLIDRKGRIHKRFAPQTTPQDLESAIQALIKD